MCKSSSKTSSTTLPGYVTDLGSQASSYATDLAGHPPTAPTAGVADFSGDQTNAFQQLRDLIANAPQVGGQAIDWTKQFATGGPQHVAVPGVDPNTLDTSAFMKAAGGPLQKTLEVIQQQADANRKGLQAQATRSGGGTGGGAVSDGQALVAQNLSDLSTERAMSDAAGSAYGTAFNSALGQANTNAGMDLQQQLANAGFGEQALQRMGTGASGLINAATGDQNRLMTQISGLLQQGGMEQGQVQKMLDAIFGQQQQTYQEPFNIAQMLSTVLASMKGTTPSTTTTTQPDNSLLGLAGSLGAAGLKAAPEALPLLM